MDDGGLGKFNRWGWCGEDCPLEGSDTTWGTDETITVTTEVLMKIDPDVYKAMIGLGIVAISLVSIAAGLKYLGILNDILNYFDKFLILEKKISQVIRWIIVKTNSPHVDQRGTSEVSKVISVAPSSAATE